MGIVSDQIHITPAKENNHVQHSAAPNTAANSLPYSHPDVLYCGDRRTSVIDGSFRHETKNGTAIYWSVVSVGYIWSDPSESGNKGKNPMEYSVIASHPKYGSTVELPDDVGTFYFQPGQKWIPHRVEGTCKFQFGAIVTVTDWLYARLKISAAVISRTRVFQYTRKGRPIKQVELLGLPLQWFHEDHFTV